MYQYQLISRLYLAIFLSTSCQTSTEVSSASAIHPPDLECRRNQKARSTELQEIVKRDQADREGFESFSEENLIEMYHRDKTRRMRVGEIFGEGCFATAADYAAAALIYQHGERPDHYWQAFVWFKRAWELGMESQRRMMGFAIDRYLVSIGHKELFASQAQTEDTCACLAPVEPSFPHERRAQVTGRSVAEAFQWIDSLNNGKNCPA